MNLYGFQKEVLEQSKDMNRVAYFYDMGLGKTYIGAEKMYQLSSCANLVVCQKSKVNDWVQHIISVYASNNKAVVFDLTAKHGIEMFLQYVEGGVPLMVVGVINYDLLFRRQELAKLKDFTLLLDESSLIQNDTSKRSRFILRRLKPKNVILLSGTPTGGKYETLWSQLYLLGWDISKGEYWNRYVDFYIDTSMGFPLKIIRGYKNVEELKRRMREHGCFFKKTEDVFELPSQNFVKIEVPSTREYRKFRKDNFVEIDGGFMMGDCALTQLLTERYLCGAYNNGKIEALKTILESTDDRVIIFYNFVKELEILQGVCDKLNKPISLVNGECKRLTAYEDKSNSVTLIQYQAGAMGLNLQKANKIVYFTPPLSSELYEQSKKRIHRIGQEKPCFYYNLTCRDSVEEKIYATLALRKDYTEQLFKGER